MGYLLLLWKWIGTASGINPNAVAVAVFETRMDTEIVMETEYESD
jgi:hypothetical protein